MDVNEYFKRRIKCPACGSRRNTTLFQADFCQSPIKEYLESLYSQVGPGVEFEYLEGSSYILEECEDCGLIYQGEVPNEFLMKRLYEHWIEPNTVLEMEKKERDARFYLGCAAEIVRGIDYLGKIPSEVKFLDFGMGWGSWCLIARGFGCDSYGADLSRSRTEHGDRLGIKVLSWDELNQHKFDFINAEQVFEHLAEPLETLAHLRNCVAPNGIIRINVPGGRDMRRKLELGDWSAPQESPDSLNDVAPLQHVNCFNFGSMVRMAQGAGLEEVEVRTEFLQPERTLDKIKSVLRPCHHALFPKSHESRRRKINNVFLKPATQKPDAVTGGG